MSPAGNGAAVAIPPGPPGSGAETIAALIPAAIKIADLEEVYRKLALKVGADRKAAGQPDSVVAWEVVTLAGGDIEVLKLEACRDAEAGGFLVGLAEGLAKSALTDAPLQEVLDLLEAARRLQAGTSGYGYMHAITATARGFLDATLIDRLPSIMRATAAVKHGMNVIGTAFLVGPDTVLSAAHVALDDNGQLKPNLSFVFSDPASATAAARSFSPRPQNPMAFSPAYGQYPNAKRVLDPDSDQHLDYVLVRLTGRVNGIKPIDLAPAPQQDSAAHVFIFGYRGGSAINVDVFTGITAKNPGKRFIHMLNAVPGMSGAPCIGPSGVVIGLHEAGFQIQPDLHENRAVDANHVLQDIVARTNKAKPLTPLNSATDYGIYDPALRLGWAKRGQLLAGAEHAEAWTRAVVNIGDPAPASGGAVREFHPLFNSGTELVTWARGVMEGTNFRRVAKVSPARRGVGASFAVDRLAAALDDPKQLFRYSVINAGPKLPHEILGVTADDDPARPIAGWTKYDVVAQAMAKIDKEGAKGKPIFVAIDFGGVGVTDQALDTWIEFIGAIIRRDGMRLILVAPPAGQDLTAGTKLPDGNDFGAGDLKAIDVRVPDEGDVLDCLRGLSAALGKPPPTTADIAAAKTIWTTETALVPVPADMAAVYAVWLVLRVMLTRNMVEG